MSIVAMLLPDFAPVVPGWLRFRSGRFGKEFRPGLEQFVYFVLFPTLLFNVGLAHCGIERPGAKAGRNMIHVPYRTAGAARNVRAIRRAGISID